MMGKLRINLTIQIGLRLAEAVACSGKKGASGKSCHPRSTAGKNGFNKLKLQ